MEYFVSGLTVRSLLSDSQDDDYTDYAETQGLLSTLWINIVIFSILMTFFEMNRHMKSIYLKRSTTKFKVDIFLFFESCTVIDRLMTDNFSPLLYRDQRECHHARANTHLHGL